MVNRKTKKNTKPDQPASQAKRGERSTINDQQPKIDINHVSKLANLSLTAQEQKTFTTQLGEILEYFKQLSKVDTTKVEPISQITGLQNITRDDKSAPSISQEDALANAPRTHNGFFEVDTIFEEV